MHLTPINLQNPNNPLRSPSTHLLFPFLLHSPKKCKSWVEATKPKTVADVTGTTENDSRGFVGRATGCSSDSIPPLLPSLVALPGERKGSHSTFPLYIEPAAFLSN